MGYVEGTNRDQAVIMALDEMVSAKYSDHLPECQAA
jgi:hypothetical protein